MAALPYMPLYIADYLADTAHLSTLEHGAYLLLIMNYWQTGHPLPNDDVKLARIVRLSSRKFHKMKPILFEMFSVSERYLTHPRIDRELQKVRQKSDKSRSSVNKRWEYLKNSIDTNVLPTNYECNTKVIPSDTDTDTDKEKNICPNLSKTPDLNVLLFPDFFDDFWKLYPRREAKKDAHKAWLQIRGNSLWSIIEQDLKTGRWAKGKFTPLAATYLRGNRWTDEHQIFLSLKEESEAARQKDLAEHQAKLEALDAEERRKYGEH
jgi:uncharacterized protein YdaU (DUF1376 family)